MKMSKNPKGKRNCSDSKEVTGSGEIPKQRDASFKTILLSKSTNPDINLDNQIQTKSDGVDQLSIKIIESPRKQIYRCFTAERTDSKMLCLEKEMEKLKLQNEGLRLDNTLLKEALKKRKCHFPKCDGQGNTNKRNNSHWSINYCPLFNEDQKSKELNLKIISELRAESRSQNIENTNIFESLKFDHKTQLINKDKDYEVLMLEKNKLENILDGLRVESDMKFKKMSDENLEKDQMILRLLNEQEVKLSIYKTEIAEDSFDLF